MSGGGKALLIGVTLLVIVAAGLFLLTWFDPQAQAARAVNTPFRVWAWRAIWVAVGAGVFLALVGGGLFVIGRGLGSIVNALTVGPEHGLFPMLLFLGKHITQPVNVPQAQVVSALAWNLDKLSQGTVKAALAPRPGEELLPAPEGPASVTPQVVTDIDPTKAPHFLLIGETGCGKSTAVYAIADALRRNLLAEFVVLEREAQNWNEQACAVTVSGYLAALESVEAERQRRAALLRAADVDHISKLAERLPYVVVILEEAESVYKAMQLLGRSQSLRYTAIVRDLAGMGRKQGVLLIVATQTGTSEVFDVPTRKNLNHKLFFRNEPAVGDAWGISRDVGLARLPTGTAYSLNHSALVRFPNAQRPRLPLSTLYYEPRPTLAAPPAPLQLPADAEADGLGAADLPDGPVVTYAADTEPLPDEINDAAGLTEAQKLRIWRTYLGTARTTRNHRPSLNLTESLLYAGQKGGVKFYLVREVVHELRRRNGGPQIVEDEE